MTGKSSDTQIFQPRRRVAYPIDMTGGCTEAR